MVARRRRLLTRARALARLHALDRLQAPAARIRALATLAAYPSPALASEGAVLQRALGPPLPRVTKLGVVAGLRTSGRDVER